ncbi:type IV pili methyl-accepting chemotaxis transducer N-terminal domain-containing protein [Pelomonas sp. APW6]|uniref:Type IV pili methyl-accepting chemotaxis transducer N-terminal domain-containing protein n=1 Tax=Roseateles subflavus TaxID=3053353 RepID=A0ABT7LRF9_9BURK|nr:type IV pili methyl-accepting chemotaxis transducer N-terminal domain-containing protein [Pelomonas sp. APW6]MDL5034061.1 type IV pili methyl-accepting chemotaxis transducer N-terminal domain-containing protein [Pelomonas sp. APW6]
MELLRRRQCLLWMPALWFAGHVHAEVRDLPDAINKAGRLRMLSQRCAKAYLALGQKVRTEQAEKVLADSMALFDRHLVELRAYAHAAPIAKVYEQMDSSWSAFKPLLVGERPSAKGADAVMVAATQVLALAQQGTALLEQSSGKPVGRLVNLAGRQRMLSQRMAATYLGAAWGVQADGLARQLNQAREEFTQAQAVLKAAPETSAALRSELEMVDQQYVFFDAALRALKPGNTDTRSLSEVFTTSERILQLMDEVTAQFARLA